MKNLKFLFTIVCLTISFSIYAALMPATDTSLSPVLAKTMPAVVNISVRGQLPPIRINIGSGGPMQNGGNQGQQVQVTPRFEGAGSGVIIDARNGIILTNAHVIKDSKIIIVTLDDGRKMQGRILGADPSSDIAIIQINAKRLTAIPFGDSDEVKVGDFVAAIGNPFGLSQTVTSGVISAMGRGNLGIEGYENFIQTDAPINPGNSGGALINMQGKLIGMNTAIITPTPMGGSIGIGLAIPSNMCKSVTEQVLKYGKIEHSLLGVVVQNITPALAETMKLPSTQGALISQVSSDTPAAKAGLQVGDVILKLNGKLVHSAYQVSTTIALLYPGTPISMEVLSNGKIKAVNTTTMSAKKEMQMQAAVQKPLLAGLSLRNFSQLVDNQEIAGVQILDVDDFSVAYSSGIRPGDVILAAAGQKVSNIAELKDIANKHPDSILLQVRRGTTGTMFTVLER
jgi:serine protease Do